ncbi:MAG: pitrilysin family protein [Bacteroidota bacterium]
MPLPPPPQIHRIEDLDIPQVKTYHITGDIPVYELSKKGCDVVMMEFVFFGGRPQEDKPLAATCTAALMREGAGSYDAEALSEEIDFHGATFTVMASMDLITLKVVCLKKHHERMLQLVQMVLCDPHLREEELSIFVGKRVERLQIELAKNDVISYRELTAGVFGREHPYGYNSEPDMYHRVTASDLRAHYAKVIHQSNCQVYIAGDTDEDMLSKIDRALHPMSREGRSLRHVHVPEVISEPSSVHHVANPAQTSIKIGRRTFNRQHADFETLFFTTTLLGGFFGSRLVNRIREELGLTYGIYSSLDPQLFDGSLMIATEVANGRVEECIDEIYKEMTDLQNIPVEEDEMLLVKNYLMGSYLNLFDGPFNSVKVIKSLLLAGIPLDNLDALIRSSMTIQPEQVMDTAKRYFNRNDFWVVTVGSPK